MSRQVAARFATAAATGQPLQSYGIARLAEGAPPVLPPDLPARALAGEGGGALDVAAAELHSIDWSHVLGGYAGALAVGGLVGFLAQGDKRGAFTGGLAAGAVWSAAETVHQWRAVHWGLGAAFLAWSGAGFYWAFKRKPRR